MHMAEIDCVRNKEWYKIVRKELIEDDYKIKLRQRYYFYYVENNE